jgi:hypothetical protein
VVARHRESPLAVLTDACAAGSTLAVCADVPRRLAGLAARAGGFALICGPALEAEPSIAARYEQVVVLDPSPGAGGEAVCRAGRGYTHLAWGEAELRFAEQMLELEHGLRASLVSLYRALRLRRRAAGEELELLLRGDGPHGRSARLAGRSLRVLAELKLVSLDRASQAPALTLGSAERTDLRSSAAYRHYERTYEDGRRFLSSARRRATA